MKTPKERSMHLVEKVAATPNEVESPEDVLLWLMSHLRRVQKTINHFYDIFDEFTAGPRSPPIDPEMVKAALTVIDGLSLAKTRSRRPNR